MKSFQVGIVLILLFLFLPLTTLVAEDNVPFAVIGEQIVHPAPQGWKLASMGGENDGRFVIEYIPEDEQIDSWREGYLAIERLPYPTAEVLKKMGVEKQKFADYALSVYIQMAKQNCGGKHDSMSQRVNTFNGVYFAVGGGFCNKYGPVAPFGEGAFVAFVQGKSFLFRIQYAWRPKSMQERNSNQPWRIIPQTAHKYLEAIKASSLCGDIGQPACKAIK